MGWYVEVYNSHGFLDAGTLGTLQVGGALRLGVHVEVDEWTLFAFEARGAVLPGGATWQARAGQARSVVQQGWDTQDDSSDDVLTAESVPEVPAPLRSGRASAGLRLSWLRGSQDTQVVAGPFLDFGWTRAWVRFEDDPDALWTVGSGGDGGTRKVFSTRREELTAAFGLEVQVGAGSK